MPGISKKADDTAVETVDLRGILQGKFLSYFLLGDRL